MKTFLLVHATSTACSDLVLTSGLNRFEVEVRVRVWHLVMMDTFEDRHWELLTVRVLMHVFVLFKTTAKLFFFPLKTAGRCIHVCLCLHCVECFQIEEGCLIFVVDNRWFVIPKLCLNNSSNNV